MKIAFGKKKHMGRQFNPDGTMVPYTEVEILPAVVIRSKKQETDGYSAAVLAVGKTGRKGKSVAGQTKAAGVSRFDFITELRNDGAASASVGSELDFNQLTTGASVTVVGTAKGRGFQGVVKRHGFHGHPTSHGHKDQTRMPGSISAGGVQHVFKGTRMAGHMGTQKVTVKNLRIVGVDAEKRVIRVLGAVPGAFNSAVEIYAQDATEIAFVVPGATNVAPQEAVANEPVVDEQVVSEEAAAE